MERLLRQLRIIDEALRNKSGFWQGTCPYQIEDGMQSKCPICRQTSFSIRAKQSRTVRAAWTRLCGLNSPRLSGARDKRNGFGDPRGSKETLVHFPQSQFAVFHRAEMAGPPSQSNILTQYWDCVVRHSDHQRSKVCLRASVSGKLSRNAVLGEGTQVGIERALSHMPPDIRSCGMSEPRR